MAETISIFILAITVGVALGRPQFAGWYLGHVEAAIGGAILTLLTGVVTPKQALNAVQILALPAITIISLMVITVIAEQAGLLRLLAYRLARSAGGDANRLFAHVFAVGAATGTLFTNDAAILILTPLVFGLVEAVQERNWTIDHKIPFYFAVLYVGNLVGALVISNPINIVVSSMFGIRFLEYFAWMMLPALVSMAASFFGLRYYFRRSLPATYRMPGSGEKPVVDRRMIGPCAGVFALTLLGFFTESWTEVPVWFVALTGALLLAGFHLSRGRSLSGVVRSIGWDVIVFVVGIFIVVIGLRNQGFAHGLGYTIASLGGTSLSGLTFATGLVAAVCSALFNNHPTAALMIWVVQDFARPVVETQVLVYAALIGGDLGPKMLPIGSLAALMWFRMLRERNVYIPYSLYVRIGVPVTLSAVALSLLMLNIEWQIYARFLK